MSEAASLLGTWEESLEVSSAPCSVGLDSDSGGQKGKDEGVALLPGDCSNPGKMASVAQGIPGKTYCLQRRTWVKGSPCQREQNRFWGAPLSEYFQALEVQLGGSWNGHVVREAAFEGCGLQVLLLCLEAGMEGTLPL